MTDSHQYRPVALLNATLVNKIAAGEVVVRPASVVKELVENSIDARSTQIDVEITNSCRDICVADDGIGMSSDDLKMALVRHATSKITSLEDLQNVRTAGFRGEALPSIAAVSRLKILTRRQDDLAGLSLEVEGGSKPSLEVHATSPGTRVEIRDLFFNVPARRKFLKSTASEVHAVVQIMTRLSLAQPHIGFSLVFNGRDRLRCRPGSSLPDRFVQILGKTFSDTLPLAAEWSVEPAIPSEDDEGVPTGSEAWPLRPKATDAKARIYRVQGVLAHPAQSAKDRTRQFFFANHRPISHRRLGFVIDEAAKGFIMVGRRPVLALFIDVPEADIDVNVHPTKDEVRFSREDIICSLVFRAVKGALENSDLAPRLRLDASSQQGGPASPSSSTIPTGPDHSRAQPDFLKAGTQQSARPHGHIDAEELNRFREIWFQKNSPSATSSSDLYGARMSPPNSRIPADPGDATPSSEASSPADPGIAYPHVNPLHEDLSNENGRQSALDAEDTFFNSAPPVVIGQISRCYIIAEVGDDAMIIDQHAAHERLLYHHFLALPRSSDSQSLLVPIIVDLPASAAALVDEVADSLASFGMIVEPFGGQTVQVTAVPASLPGLDAAALLVDLLEDFEREGKQREWEEIRHRVAARMACRAAVKSGDRMSHEEMNRLITDLRCARVPFTCPHGRPTMLLLKREELDHQFKRK